jgi:DNA-binding CsgD family transcriptional regulator
VTHSAPAKAGDPLTPTDLDTLRLVANGRTAEQIAHELHVSYHTISTRLSQIYRKLNVTDRTSAVVTAHQLGLLSLACPPRTLDLTELREQLATATARAEQAEAARDGAYRERAQLTAWLATIHPAVITPAPDVDDPGWQILYLTAGGRQLSWHIAPRDADLFTHVEHVGPDDPRAQWDGHTTEQKYQAIRSMTFGDLCGPSELTVHRVRALSAALRGWPTKTYRPGLIANLIDDVLDGRYDPSTEPLERTDA